MAGVQKYATRGSSGEHFDTGDSTLYTQPSSQQPSDAVRIIFPGTEGRDELHSKVGTRYLDPNGGHSSRPNAAPETSGLQDRAAPLSPTSTSKNPPSGGSSRWFLLLALLIGAIAYAIFSRKQNSLV